MSAVDIRKDWDGELLSSKGHSKLRVVEPTATRFMPLSLASVLALPPQRWLVDGLFPERGLTVIYGAPGSAKTFLALDLAFRIAQGGGDWFGRAAKGGSVVMVAGEGIHGLAGRCRAYCAHPQKMNPDADVDAALHVVPHPPNLFEGDADEFVASIASLQPTMVIIDTLSRSSVGADENSARDMGQVIAAADSIVKKLGCLVLLVHHARKGMSGGERGSSALRGAADAMFEIARKGDSGVRELVLSGGSAKMKDAAESESIFFRLEAVGESCVIVDADTVKLEARHRARFKFFSFDNWPPKPVESEAKNG